MCVCKANIGSSLLCDSCELTLGLFFLVLEITFTFLLTRDCRFAYCFVLIVDLSLTTVLLIKFYFDLQCYKVKNSINSDTLTLPPP